MKEKKTAADKTGKDNMIVNDIQYMEELLLDQSGLESAGTIIEPSDEAVARLTVIPLLFDEPRNLATRVGAIAYDSWSQGSPVALRDVTDGHIRRMRMRAEKIALEVVAEMSQGRWEFVARAYRGAAVVHDFVLNVGRKKLLSESGGFFRWSSKSVPRKIILVSLRERLTFEGLPW